MKAAWIAVIRLSEERSMRSAQHGCDYLDPDDLEGIYEYLRPREVVDGPDELRHIVEENWPELLHKLKPPRHRMH
jgi:hypothetical protein